MNTQKRVAFGGGCHWCTEAVFKALKGVINVAQGYVCSSPPLDSFSEGVIIDYNPQEITLEQLIEIHLYTHKSTSNHSFRTKYRSAMYYYEDEDASAFAKAKQHLQAFFDKPIITQALPFVDFKPSRESITDYYAKNPEAPFCTRYIEPKLDFLAARYRKLLD